MKINWRQVAVGLVGCAVLNADAVPLHFVRRDATARLTADANLFDALVWAGPDYSYVAATDERQSPVAHVTSVDMVLIKVDRNGKHLWSSGRCPLESADNIHADTLCGMAVQTDGSVVLTGHCDASPGFWVRTSKFDSEGKRLWSSAVNLEFKAGKIIGPVVDSEGNITIATTITTNGFSDILLLNYDQTGRERWRKMFDGKAHEFDYAVTLMADRSGNPIVAGMSSGGVERLFGSNTGSDCAVIKYSTRGKKLWGHVRDSGFGAEDALQTAAIGLDDGVFYAGKITAGILRHDFIRKLDSKGRQAWEMVFPREDPARSFFHLKPTASGGLCVVGTVDTDAGADLFVASISNAGKIEWLKTWTGPLDDFPGGMTLDNAGNVFVALTSCTSNGAEIVLVSFDPAGGQRFEQRFDGKFQQVWPYPTASPRATVARAYDLTLDREGCPLVAGFSTSQMIVVKFSPKGEQLWATGFSQHEESSASH